MKIRNIALTLLFALLLAVLAESTVQPRAQSVTPDSPAPLEVVFSHLSGFYDAAFSLTLTTPDDAQVFYTLNGNPTTKCVRDTEYFKAVSESPAVDIRYTTPIPVTVGANADTFSVRAYAVRGGEVSPVVTHTFVKGLGIHTRFSESTLVFVLNGDPHGLYNHHDGVMVAGVDRQNWIDDFTRRNGRPPRPGPSWEIFPPGEWGAGGPGEIEPNRPANFNRNGRESEREVFFQLFEHDGTMRLSQRAGVRVKGGYSRAHNQKSLELYAREEDYGVQRFDYPFFGENAQDGNIMNSYRRVRLRNGGSDRSEAFLRDEFSQTMLRQAGIPSTQTHTPAAVFINGEYYGVSWLKSPRTENHLRRMYGGETERFRAIGGSENGYGNHFWEGESDATADWSEVFRLANGMNLTNETRWAEFTSRVCIDSMMLYYAYNVYIQNLDWPNHNMEMWRYFPTDEERADTELHEHLRDGKWRWMPHDIEAAWNIYNSAPANINTIHNILRGGGGVSNPQWQGTSAMLNAVLEREDMRGRFANTLIDLIEGVLTPDNAEKELDTLIARIRPEHEYALRAKTFGDGWPHSESVHDSRELMRAYINERPAQMLSMIGRQWKAVSNSGLGLSAANRSGLTLKTTAGGGAVMNARIVGEQSQAIGNYYNGTSVDITAKPYPGYEVSHWFIGGTRRDATDKVTITINGAQTVEIYYKKSANVNLRVTAIRAAGDRDSWLEVFNPTDKALSTKGLYLTDGSDKHKWRCPAVIVRAGETVRIAANRNETDVTLKNMRMNFNLSFRETLQVSNSRKTVLQSADVTLMKDWQIQALSREGVWRVVNDSEPPQKPQLSAPIRLMAQDSISWTKREGDVVNITGNGTYTATLNLPPSEHIASLALMSDTATFRYPNGFAHVPVLPAAWGDVQVNVTSVRINGASANSGVNFTERLVKRGDEAGGGGRVNIEIWTAWWEPNQRLVGVNKLPIDSEGAHAFTLSGGEPLTSFTVEFTVSGIPE
ncbi:MAG: CotH kinase family protein [Oscillospiraceae bacterium]|nr:CotH kinase family protein [Oscillospiraceae bacterium]